MNKRRGNKVRIIAGRLRGRLVTFADHDGLRPTGDRLRETLFSWLQPSLPGSRSLDMFAGSGVLGFESISRGGSSTVLFEKSAAVGRVLEDNVASLGIGEADVVCADVLQTGVIERYCDADSIDIAYIDPPFDAALQQCAANRLRASGVLARDSLVAIENSRHAADLKVPDGWQLKREKVAGEVRLQLFLVAR
ncbi:MAG: 16S rRNA (guanine(966)-N(2))-methyltransferase RsmD [Pseudomonadota bacterium]